MKTLIALLLFTTSLFAANHYVLDGAAGANDGSSWTDAWDALPTPLTRGDTYYIGDGTYASYDFDDAVSGATLITIKKATVADHGTATGWNDAFGDGQAEWTASGTPITFSSSYWLFDGQVGSGNSGHGFKSTVTGTGDATRGVRITAPSNITIAHVEITSTNPEGVADGSKQDGVYSTAASDVTVQSCYIHNWKRCAILFSGVTGWTVEYCYMYHTYSTSGAHGQAIQMGPGVVSDVDIRYNTFKDCHGTGVIVALDNVFDDLRIYGNVLWEDEDAAAIGIFAVSQALGITTGDTANNWQIYNNSFVGLNGRASSGDIDLSAGTNNIIRNNLWYDCNVTGFGASETNHDYSWFYPSGGTGGDFGEGNGEVGAGDPFVDSALGDFHLSANTTAGVNLGAPYNEDMDGVARATWSRGAYEYAPDVTAPVISADSTTPTSQTTATAQWTTDETCNTNSVTVWNAAGTNTFTASNGTDHTVGITGLTASTLYTNWFVSFDTSGNGTTNTAFTFTTLSATNDPTLTRVRITGGVTISGGVTIR